MDGPFTKENLAFDGLTYHLEMIFPDQTKSRISHNNPQSLLKAANELYSRKLTGLSKDNTEKSDSKD